ncbi:MAG: TonB family protein [Gemmatimonadetes bacterium]|nr:TonB family protein [Gemmatimonadota bacterium]NIQ58978.1 TonB family protein [Gemmatimonadota bacterium]NIU79185.1 TonB family protein [Gammaproteobacteria bacterium]NIX47869.1 TonB family protein [Gemmatimonadota bacterium]NIY12240.1 TonB family protein [Gemmatimonadota bacterium]
MTSSDDGRPIPYAQVRVMGDSISDWTDDAGAYRLEGLTRGPWRIRVVHPGHDSLDLRVVVPGDRAVRLDVTLAARPGPSVDALSDFEPFQVAYTLPALLNPAEVSHMIQQQYPAELAARGIGGEAVLRLWLDERGRVVRSLLSASSGQAALDSIALSISEQMRFRPAKNRDQMVRVIVRIPVLFTVPDSVRRAGRPGPPG